MRPREEFVAREGGAPFDGSCLQFQENRRYARLPAMLVDSVLVTGK
jgi:hypothetical protein